MELIEHTKHKDNMGRVQDKLGKRRFKSRFDIPVYLLLLHDSVRSIP